MNLINATSEEATVAEQNTGIYLKKIVENFKLTQHELNKSHKKWT